MTIEKIAFFGCLPKFLARTLPEQCPLQFSSLILLSIQKINSHPKPYPYGLLTFLGSGAGIAPGSSRVCLPTETRYRLSTCRLADCWLSES
jgi:hypothetical protein